jgi:hypothetical protein
MNADACTAALVVSAMLLSSDITVFTEAVQRRSPRKSKAETQTFLLLATGAAAASLEPPVEQLKAALVMLLPLTTRLTFVVAVGIATSMQTHWRLPLSATTLL